MVKDSPNGLWDANDQMEDSAARHLKVALGEFGSVISGAYEAAVLAPTLSGARQGEPDLLAAALFLKRTIVDLRATWLLLTRGYSSPAATAAASLWEHALACMTLAGDPERAGELRSTEAGDLPWSPKELAEVAARRVKSVLVQDEEVVRQRAKNIYASYKWLCKIKHPTLRSALHDAGAAEGSDGRYVVMACPDVRPENLPLAEMVLTIACGRTIEAAWAFADALACDKDDATYRGFADRLRQTEARLLALVRQRPGPLPFGLTISEGAKL